MGTIRAAFSETLRGCLENLFLGDAADSEEETTFTENLCIEQAVDSLNDPQIPLGKPEKIRPGQADALPAAKMGIKIVDCFGLCGE